jgi:hypothetical protein
MHLKFILVNEGVMLYELLYEITLSLRFRYGQGN